MAIKDLFENQQVDFAVNGTDPEPVPEWQPNAAEPYQVMRPLTAEERAALKAAIQEHGIRQPIEVDENGNILDGHSRRDICLELQIPCPFVVVAHLKTPQEKRDYARQINCARRAPAFEERIRVAEQALREDKTRTNYAIGQIAGVRWEAVKRLREKLGLPEVIVTDEIDARVAAEPPFPFLETAAWKVWHKMEALSYLGVIEKPAQEILTALLMEIERRPEDGIAMLRRAAQFSEKDRNRLAELWVENTERARSLIQSKLNGLPPMPDPRLALLAGAIDQCRQVQQLCHGERDQRSISEIEDRLMMHLRQLAAEDRGW